MIVLIIALIVVTVTYSVAATIKTKELPDSISAMVYSFGKAGRWIWTLWMFLCTFLVLPPLIEAMPDNVQFLAFFTGASLAFCGAMPLVKNERNDGHYICGIIAGIFSQICVVYICRECMAVWFLLPIARILMSRETFYRIFVLILEMICTSTIILTLFIHYTIII